MGKSTHFLSKVISYLQKKLSKIETTKKLSNFTLNIESLWVHIVYY